MARRHAVPLSEVLALVHEWYPSWNQVAQRRKALIWPEAVILLKSAVHTCKKDQESITAWLRDRPDVRAPEIAEWYHHLLCRLVQSPVDYELTRSTGNGPVGMDTVVNRCAEALMSLLCQANSLISDSSPNVQGKSLMSSH